MGIIGKTIKLSIPFGSLYYADNKLELFSVSVGSAKAEDRLAKQRATVNNYVKCIKNSLESNLLFKFPQLITDFNLRQYWNCACYTTFKSLANLNTTRLIDQTTNALVKLFDQKPAIDNAKSVVN